MIITKVDTIRNREPIPLPEPWLAGASVCVFVVPGSAAREGGQT